jgi:hypothetical protein
MAGIEGIRAPRVGAAEPQARTAPLNPEATKALVETIKGAVALTPEEKTAMAALPPLQRAQYQTVAARLSGPDREAFAKLLIEGKLTAGRDLKMRGDLLGNLANLATQPLEPGIDRRELVAQAIRNVADPSTITQGAEDTCGAATQQILLAKENPAEYVRILSGLASQEGKVELVGGQTLTRPKNWSQADIPGQGSQLLQTAFMAYAAGGYDVATDTRADGEKGGLYASEVAYLQEGILGRAINTVMGDDPQILDKIAAQANSGRPVSVLIEVEGKGHYVQVSAVKDGKLTYTDPRDGKTHTVDAAGFAPLIKAADLEAKPGTALKAARPTDKQGIMGGCGVIKAIVKAVTSVVRAVVNVVKKAVSAVVNIVKATVSLVKNVALATVAVFKTIAKVTLTIAQTALRVGYYLATLRFGSALNAAKEGVKKAWEETKEGASEVWKHTKAALKDVGTIIMEGIKLAEATIPGFKLVTDFMKTELGQKILMALAILSMIPPLTVIAPVMMAIALYQGAQMLGQGLQNGDFKMAAMGLLTVASSAVGLKGAVGGAGAVSAGTQKALNIATGAVKAGVALESGDIKGAILAGAAVGSAAGGSAVAQQVTNLATKGFAIADAVQNKDWMAVGAATVAVAAGGLALASMDTDDSKPKTGIAKMWDDAKNWVGEKVDAFVESPVGKVVMAPVNWVKSGLNAADEFMFGEKINVLQPDGTMAEIRKPGDGLVPKVTGWFKENVQDPVAKAFTPAKEELGKLTGKIDESVKSLKSPLTDAAKATDTAAYGEDGKSGIVGGAKDAISKGFAPVRDGAAAGSAAIKDGATAAANKLSSMVGKEPTTAQTPGTTGVPPAPGAAPTPAVAAAPGATPAEGPDAEKPWYQKAVDWGKGKYDAAKTNVNNVMGKVEAVKADVAPVQNDIAAKLASINKAHDTFMAGVETVKSVTSGEATKALRQGGQFLAGVGYTDLGNGMNALADKADQARSVKKAVETGDVGTGLEAAGSFAGLNDVAATGRKITQGQRMLESAKSGNAASAVWNAGQFIGSEETIDAGNRLFALDDTKRAMDEGDVAGALDGAGRFSGSKAIGNAGTTARNAQYAKEAADRGEVGNAMYFAGRAADNKDMQNLGDRVDSGEEALRNAQGTDRYGRKLTDAERIAGVMGNTGRAVDSDELQTGERAVNQADRLNQAFDRKNQMQAMNAASDLASTLGRKQASRNMRDNVEEQEKRESLAREIGEEVEGERTVDLMNTVARTQGMQAQDISMQADAEAKEVERKAKFAGDILAKGEDIGKKLTGRG